MSFDIICDNCGAPSSPSAGTCPFCKAIMINDKIKANPVLAKVKKLYADGKMTQALLLCNSMWKDHNKKQEGLGFLMTYAKVLIETEAPSHKTNSVLGKAFLLFPSNDEVNEYLEIMQAKKQLVKGKDDDGELMLKRILRKNPKNPHALFILAAHIFLVDQDVEHSLRYLERCISYRRNFLRAWGCLATLYRSIGQTHLARKAYSEAIRLENDKNMKKFFRQQKESL